MARGRPTLRISLRLPLARADWPVRMEEACRVVEEAFPTEDLRVATSYREGGGPTFVRDRAAFFAKTARTRTRWFSLHSGDPNLGERCDRTVRFEGYAPRGTLESVVTLGGARGGGHDELYRLEVISPERSWDLHERLLVALGDATGAFASHLSPADTDARLRAVQWGWHPLALSEAEARLPTLANTDHGGLATPEQPGFAGWLNYWSEPTARFLAFPDTRRDADLLAHAHRTPRGAWLVKLGPEPLDAARAEHLELLRSVYERFPGLGVRGRRLW